MCHQCRCTKPPEKEELLNIWEDKAKAYIVRQDEEAFLEPLNISVDKKTQERDRADISLGWYFAIYSDVWIGGIGGGPGSAAPTCAVLVKKWFTTGDSKSSEIIGAQWGKSHQQCAALGSWEPTLCQRKRAFDGNSLKLKIYRKVLSGSAKIL